MPMAGGLVAHTLNETRDLNDPKPLFEPLEGMKADPEMVKLAIQLIDRQTGRYDPADIADRYEARLREVIEAKLKGEGIEPAEDETDRSNVIDLVSALRQSLGQASGKAAARQPAKPAPPKPAPGRAAKKPARKRV
ncbi:MAG: hypothetical protein WDN49_01480 [Acetobacteraceae bacterium]